MSDIVIRNPDPGEHERTGNILVVQAQEAVIDSNDSRELAGSIVEELNQQIAQIEREFNGTDEEPGPVTLSYRAWKSGVALRERALKARVDAKTIWTQKVRRFEYDVEQARLAESRKAEAEARKKAEAERARQIEAARKLKDKEAVENLKAAPIDVYVPPPVTPAVTKADGLRRSTPDWDFNVTDPLKVPRRYLMVDEKAIRATVKRLGKMHGIPGIAVFDRRSEGG